MKVKLTPILGAIIGIALFSIPITVSAQTIIGSSHDFLAKGWVNLDPTGRGDEICVVCHTPHNSDSRPDAPLWNHAVTAATFDPYVSNTLDATVAQPDGVSLICLSCHDGTVGLDSFGGTPPPVDERISGPALIGTVLENDHPVSFTYDTTLATNDGGLHDPTTASSGLGGTIDLDMLRAGKVQCASCHNPHDQTNGMFLRKSNAGSALCLTCHNK